MAQPNPVRLKDIAKKTGLTINTVSRAIQDKPDISDATKRLVQQVAKELGYVPNVIARSMRSGFTNTIGIVFDNISNPYYMIMTDLLHQELQQQGYDVFIITSSGENGKFDQVTLNKILSRKIDGIISFLKPNEATANLIKENHIPIVIIGREGDDLGLDSVYTNDVSGGYQVGEYFKKQGYTHVGYIGAPEDILCSVKRHEGLKKSLAKTKDITLETIYLNHGDMEMKQKVDRLIQAGAEAIFCFNDVMAMEAYSYLKSQTRYQKKEIAIIGYDNILKNLNIPLPIPSVDSDKKLLAKKTTEAVLNRIKDYHQPLVKVVLDCHFTKQ
jgi:LacI family transcriptional regulator